MTIATILKLVSALFQWLHDKQLMDAGAAKAALKGLEDAQTLHDAAIAARNQPDSVPDDTVDRNK